MGRGQRAGLVVSAVVVAAIAFVVLRPDDADEPPPPADQAGQTEGEEQAGAGETQQEPEPAFETIRIANGEVRGGEQRISVSRGDTARIEVRSDAPEDIHLHGYDISRQAGPGEPARFRFKADLEGAFELEAHELGNVTIATLVVEP